MSDESLEPDELEDEDEVDGYYRLSLRIDTHLIPIAESDDFVDKYEGNILHCDGFGDPERAGRVRAYVVNICGARESGVAILDVFDGHSQELLQYYEAMFEPGMDDYRPSIETRFETWGADLLILDVIEILPGHRGLGLGLAVASRLIDLLGQGCDLVACRPFPIQSDTARGPGSDLCGDPDFKAKMKYEDLEPDKNIAMRQLRSHWGRLGFERIGRGHYYCLSPARVRPELKSICDPRLF